ncbi:MAG: hypothetical protein H0X03_00385 [Nitrosopumilus sp.]|nr:hypothetical protein [Nitrosopumilus sp.]
MVVEPILILCINDGASISELESLLQREYLFAHHSYSTYLKNILKKYLFYMIEYEFISYNRQTQMYMIKKEGLDLLFMIKREKKLSNGNSKNIIIRIEKDSIKK